MSLSLNGIGSLIEDFSFLKRSSEFCIVVSVDSFLCTLAQNGLKVAFDSSAVGVQRCWTFML